MTTTSALPDIPSANINQDQQIRASYDEVIYHSHIVVCADPENACVLARLTGINAPDPRKAKILELACGTGTNLMNIALRFPQAECIGIDLAPKQVAIAQKLAQDLGLSNVQFFAKSILDIEADFGEFDYIIAHGVYSWVPAEVQKKILAICRTNMSPHGVAMVSYNVRPGWAVRGLIRDMMLFQAAPFEEPGRKIKEARAILQFLAELDWPAENPYGTFLKNELTMINRQRDYYIYHEFLEGNNEPLYFHQFNDRLRQANLQYLGDAIFSDMLLETLSPKAQQALRQTNDRIRLEQYMDYVRYRQFRHSLIVQQEATISTITPNQLAGLWVGGNVIMDARDLFDNQPLVCRSAGVNIDMTLQYPFYKVAFSIVQKLYPNFILLEELFEQAKEECEKRDIVIDNTAQQGLRGTLLQAGLLGFCKFLIGAPSWATSMGNCPKLHPLARWQIRTDNGIAPSLMHQVAQLAEHRRPLAELLDGIRTMAEIRTAYADLMAAQQNLDPSIPKKNRQGWFDECDQAVQDFLKLGLFIPEKTN